MSKVATESIRFAGDVNIRRLEVVSSNKYKIDMTNQVIGIELYEDIFAPFITIALTIRESQDFINALPLRGEEVVNLEISTPTYTKDDQIIKGLFYIYKLSDRVLFTERNAAYTLYCISYEALYDLNLKLSKAYRGNVADIAKEFMGTEGLNTTKKYYIEPTKNSTKYISNFWSPVKNLNFLTTNAMNIDGNASYLFFENRTGFNFVSLDKLYAQEPYQKFIKDDYVRDSSGNTSTRNLNREYQRILDIKVKVLFDSVKTINNGAFASRLYSYDLVKKKYTAKDYNFLSNYAKYSHLNKGSLYTDLKPVSPMSFIYNEVKHYASHNGFPDTSNTNFQQQRNSKLNLIRSSVIEISVLGRTDYTIGQKVYVEIPKPTIMTEKEQANTNSQNGFIDSTYSGNYIITAINHVINREKHTCVLELSKESRME